MRLVGVVEFKFYSYEVEKILAHRKVPNLGLEYLIKWKGYPESENTWVPLHQLVSKIILFPFFVILLIHSV